MRRRVCVPAPFSGFALWAYPCTPVPLVGFSVGSTPAPAVGLPSKVARWPRERLRRLFETPGLHYGTARPFYRLAADCTCVGVSFHLAFFLSIHDAAVVCFGDF